MFTTTVIAFLFGYVQLGASIRCYECSSANNSMCLEPTEYDKETLGRFLSATECRQGIHALAPDGNYDFFCRKIVQTILHKHHDSEVRVTRGCGWRRHHRDCYKADNDDHFETVCQCFTDGCNSAQNLHLSLSPILISLVSFFCRK